MDKGNNVKPKVTPDALTQLEMAKEKARIMERKLVTALSELEQAAENWKKEVEPWIKNERM